MMVTMIGMMMVSQTSTYGHVLSHHFFVLFNRQQVDITDKKGEDVDEKQMNVFLDSSDLKVSTAKSHNPGDSDVEDMVTGAGLDKVWQDPFVIIDIFQVKFHGVFTTNILVIVGEAN